MSEFASFCDVIELWPSKEAMAAELAVNVPAVIKWWQRDSIPSKMWQPILATPIAARGGLSPATLALLAARDRSTKTQETGADAST